VGLAALAAALAVRALDRGGDAGPGVAPQADVGRSARLDGTVVRVVDGDTVRVALGGREERVRYIGIDTPETGRSGGPRECFALRAGAENRRLVAGERVRLRTDADPRDRYGRLLAYVTRRRDGLFVNLALVRRGFATVLTIPPNVAHAEDFLAAERRARSERAGLWAACG
jgi:micrococcal nuclease